MQLPDRYWREFSPITYFYNFRRDPDLFFKQNIPLRLARMGYVFKIFRPPIVTRLW